MKHLGLVWVLLLLGIGALMWSAVAQLTAYQSVPPALNVGENAMVTVSLTYYGSDATQAIITPELLRALRPAIRKVRQHNCIPA